jgi:hypothetical protein
MNTPDVLSSIIRRLREVELLMIEHLQYDSARARLEECQRNLERIRATVSLATLQSISSSIAGLMGICSNREFHPNDNDAALRSDREKRVSCRTCKHW